MEDIHIPGLRPDSIYILFPENFDGYPAEYLQMSFLRHDRVANLYASCIILAVAATAAVVLRGVAKRKAQQKFGWDDYTILLGLVSCIHHPSAKARLADDSSQIFHLALCVTILVCIYAAGYGRHVPYLTFPQWDRFWSVCMQARGGGSDNQDRLG